MDIVRAEMSALAHVVIPRRRRHCGDADRIGRAANVEDPDQLEAIFLMIEHCLIKNDQEIAIRQWKAIVGAAAEWR